MRVFAILFFLLCLTLGNGSSVLSTTKIANSASLNNTSIDVNIVRPVAGAVVGSNLDVVVTVSSTFEIKSVKANVAGRETALAFSSTSGWTGSISLLGLARGEQLLTVTATDVFDNAVQVQRKFTYDQFPTLTVAAPLAETVARPSLFVDVRCTDDDPAGCSLLTIIDDAQRVLARGTSSIQGTIFLSALDGRFTTLHIRATDSRGQFVDVLRNVFVESSNNLTEVETVSGHIIDVQPDRILFLENGRALKIRDRATHQDIVVMDDPVKVPLVGFLTQKGAIFVAGVVSLNDVRVYEQRDGTLMEIGFPNSFVSLTVKGNYAIWNEQPKLIRRDLTLGTNLQVSNSAGNWRNDVAADGKVFYWGTDYNIYRYDGGITTKLTDATQFMNTYPLTDGINVVYRKGLGIAMYGQSGETSLAPPRTQQSPDLEPKSDYQANGGWVAFTDLGNGPFQVWLCSPDGTRAQISFFGTSSFIKGLSPKGGVIFSNHVRSYLKETDSSLVDLNSSLGEAFWQNEQWYVTIGRTLFRVNTTPDPIPTLLMQGTSQRAIALNAVTFLSSPFPIITGPQNLSPDQRTRVMLLASNITLMPGDNTSAVFVQAEDSQHRLYSLPVEYVGRVPNFDWLTQINVSLPDELKGAGDVWVNINVRGVVSNRALINLQ